MENNTSLEAVHMLNQKDLLSRLSIDMNTIYELITNMII